MILKDINIRPMREADIPKFEQFRRSYWDGDLELPKGWAGNGWETAVAESGDRPIASLTGSVAGVLDPLIRNPQIKSGTELVASIYALERTLTYQLQKRGAIDAYIAIPDHLVEYHNIVKKAGYVETLNNCKVFRRALVPDTQPLIGPEMEAERVRIVAEMNEAKLEEESGSDEPKLVE